MRIDPWKLAAAVLALAFVHEVALPDVAHAPGTDAQAMPAPTHDSATPLEVQAPEHRTR